MNKKRIFRLLLTGLILGLICSVGAILISRQIIDTVSDKKTFSDANFLPKSDVALVLGCSRYLSDGRENLFFRNRINAAVDVFKSGKVEFILVSGDNHRIDYDEPTDMKGALIEKGIPAGRIYCDYAGFSTLDSIVRAKEVFGQSQVVVISQEFHNKRAIFIGEQRGLDVYGYNAAEVGTFISFKTKAREELAKVKAVIDVWVLGREPRFLGEAVEIGA
ncbi:SanA/YdcF family protein [Rubellicoccus peritrichatus]|uniref:ElyC/SanA/YdcF family protein n=1 Tax=Rubellicoccus peritrichatus TaxID=3080537 RepID=A0AAQ3L9F9_9BACT|nr:ElyC/SanA/YdcF family protein [Puniceicoccus sp. CR14]WOO42074.1 ElyC/SanA/YdcF family protein [Puniceicoccus sp. CR14]